MTKKSKLYDPLWLSLVALRYSSLMRLNPTSRELRLLFRLLRSLAALKGCGLSDQAMHRSALHILRAWATELTVSRKFPTYLCDSAADGTSAKKCKCLNGSDLCGKCRQDWIDRFGSMTWSLKELSKRTLSTR